MQFTWFSTPPLRKAVILRSGATKNLSDASEPMLLRFHRMMSSKESIPEEKQL